MDFDSYYASTLEPILQQFEETRLSVKKKILMAIGICLLTAAVSCLALDLGKWVPNIGAFAKFLFFGAIIIGAWHYSSTHGMANPLNADTLAIRWGAQAEPGRRVNTFVSLTDLAPTFLKAAGA